jgi:mannosyltransferase PIG-V
MSETTAEKSPEIEAWNRLIALLSKRDWLVVGWALAIKALLFVFGAKSYQILEDRRAPNINAWLEIWNRWDAAHYLQVARTGYNAKDVLVYPLFPWLTRFFAQVSGDYLTGALMLSGIASVVAAVLLQRLARLDYPAPVALRAAWFFLIFPTSYFLHIGYTESLFLALTFGCLLAARTERWWLAGILGALSSMTRAGGLALLPTLAVEAAHQCLVTKRWSWRWLWIAIVPAGFGAYLLINFHAAGGAFAFWGARKSMFYTSPAWPWVGIGELVGNLHRTPGQGELVGAQELYFVALGFVCTVVSCFQLRPLYAVWMTVTWFGITSFTFIQSAPRYSLTMFPIFILFALLGRHRFWNKVMTIWSFLFLALFTSLFVRGWWAF